MHTPRHIPEIPPWLAKWFEDQRNPYPRDGSYNFYNPNAGQQVGPLEVPFNTAAAWNAQGQGYGAETPSRTFGRQVGAAEYPSGQIIKFPSWMGGPPGQMTGNNYAQFLMNFISQRNRDSTPNPFSEMKANPLMAELLAAKAGRGPNPYDPSGILTGPMPNPAPRPPKYPRPRPQQPSPLPPMPRPRPRPQPPTTRPPVPQIASHGFNVQRSPYAPVKKAPTGFNVQRSPYAPVKKAPVTKPSLSQFTPRFTRPKKGPF